MSAAELRTAESDFCHFAGQALFSVNKGFDLLDALEHASSLLSCANHLTQRVACETAGAAEAHAAQHLGEMAKALIDACIGGALSGNGGGK